MPAYEVREAAEHYEAEAPSASEPLKRAQKAGLCLLLVVVIAFGAWVEFRGAFLKTRRTDIGPYLRAAWAVRTGNNIYDVTDNRGWHYVYPPLFAIIMAPLADPPPGADRSGYMPYEISVGLWYTLTLIMGLLGAHILARALEDTSGNPAVRGQPSFCRRWWALRILPVLVLLPAIGRSQMRGQIGLLIAFLLCIAAAALLRGKKFRAGLWLSAAICVKMIPAFLLLFPVWRRNWRMLAGSIAGLGIGLIIIPAIAIGPQKAINAYSTFFHEVILSGISGDAKGRLGGELTGITSTDSNSPMVVMHNIIHPDKSRRPKTAAGGVRFAHWLIAFLLTAVTLNAAGWRKADYRSSGTPEAGNREMVFSGALIALMIIISPVFHPHYVSMLIPSVMALFSMLWDRHGYPKIPAMWKALFWALFVSHALTSIDRGVFFYLRDFGLVLLTTLLLWAGSIYLLRPAAGDARARRLPDRRRGNADYDIRSIAVILPVFNERDTIGRTFDTVKAFADENPRYSFLFVDDGSYDGTTQILRNAVNRKGNGSIGLLWYEQNKGKGHAVRSGFRAAEADALIFMDSDMAYTLDYLKLMEERLKTSDLVIGSRKLSSAKRNGRPLRRHILGECYNRLARAMLDLSFRDTQAGLKGFRLKAARQIFGKCSISGFGFDTEVLFLARKAKLRVTEVSVSEDKKHFYKKGKLKLLKDSVIMFCNLLLIWWRGRAGGYG